jgi:hypothetical protein
MWWTRYRCGAEINVDSIIEVLTKEGNLTRDKFANIMCSYASSDRRDYDITGPIKSSHWKKRVSFWDNNYGFSDENFSKNFWWFFSISRRTEAQNFYLLLFKPSFFSHHCIMTFLCTMKCWWNCFQEFKSKYEIRLKQQLSIK